MIPGYVQFHSSPRRYHIKILISRCCIVLTRTIELNNCSVKHLVLKWLYKQEKKVNWFCYETILYWSLSGFCLAAGGFFWRCCSFWFCVIWTDSAKLQSKPKINYDPDKKNDPWGRNQKTWKMFSSYRNTNFENY